jgi:hypothetical protein
MELVAWLAGEDHGDAPRSACPTLTVLVRAANDLVPDPRREALLRPLAPRLVGSRAEDPQVAIHRAWIAADAAGRFFAALRLARLERFDAAEELRALPRIDGATSAAYVASRLARHGRELRAATWTLHAAGQDAPARVWLPGVVHALRDAAAWSCLPRLVEDLLVLRAAVR